VNGRYSTSLMSNLWSEQTKFEYWLLVEQSVAWAQAELGIIPKSLYPKLKKAKIDVKAITEYEEIVQHDVIAFLKSIEKSLGKDAKFLHFGLTSYDIVDTALALRCLIGCDYIISALKDFAQATKQLAQKHKYTLMMGRTHGIHAQPITFGLKCLSWYQEIIRNILRLQTCQKNLGYGKISGAVGAYTEINPRVEALALKRLGLKPEPVSTQVIPRDRYAELLNTLAVIASGLERIATEIRNLQRSEISEVSEPFKQEQQGSSAMPHKKNPIVCERICSLARVVRSFAVVGLENIPLWHERDLTNSANERIIIPGAFNLVHYMLLKLNGVISGLMVCPDKMKENIDKSKEQFFSQGLMMAMIQKGMNRDKAYKITQKLAFEAKEKDENLSKLVLENAEIKKLFQKKEIENLFSWKKLRTNADYIFKRIKD
jgi:adenylosuccinate lyase